MNSSIGKSDKELIKKYINGNDEAFEVLLNRYKDKVYSYIYFTVRDEEVANDVFQDTFVKVIQTIKKGRYKDKVYSYIYFTVRDEEVANDVFQDTFVKVIQTIKKGRYNEEGKFLPWIMRIAHNLMIDHFRRNTKMPMVKGGEDFDMFDVLTCKDKSINEKLEIKQNHKLIKSLIQELPSDQREVVMMRLYYDMSFKEIAATTNVSINTALGRMRYAIINLRKMIEERNIPVYL